MEGRERMKVRKEGMKVKVRKEDEGGEGWEGRKEGRLGWMDGRKEGKE